MAFPAQRVLRVRAGRCGPKALSAVRGDLLREGWSGSTGGAIFPISVDALLVIPKRYNNKARPLGACLELAYMPPAWPINRVLWVQTQALRDQCSSSAWNWMELGLWKIPEVLRKPLGGLIK